MPWEIARGSGKWEPITAEYAENAISGIRGVSPKHTMEYLKRKNGKEGITGGTITHSWMIRYRKEVK